MTRSPLLWAFGGLASVLVGIGGFAAWGSSVADEAQAGWLPTCAHTLGEDYESVDAERVVDEDSGHIFLFGIDRSPSNAERANEQLAAAVELASGLGVEHGAGILFVSDRSDRSSTPDLPFEAPSAPERVRVTPLPCEPDCEPHSLFEQQCLDNIESALESRAEEERSGIAEARESRRLARAERIGGWHERVQTFWPKPGTSILRFWSKVADLPAVRHSPERVTVVLLGDLEEARTRERRQIARFQRAIRKDPGACPNAALIPGELAGVEVVLLQTVTDGIDAERWGRTWEALLECAGVHVSRFRYTAALPLTEYLHPPT